jgi:hypothetical protein
MHNNRLRTDEWHPSDNHPHHLLSLLLEQDISVQI